MANAKPNVLLLTGGDIHDFDTGAPIIEQALSHRFNVTTTRELSDVKNLPSSDYKAIVVYTQGRKGQMTDDIAKALQQYVEAGGGFVGIHCASDTFTDNATYMKLIGSQFASHGPVTEFTVRFTDPAHPCAARTEPFRVTDELYILKDHADYETFAVANWQGKDRPMAYQRNVGKGKLIYLANGHDHRSLSSRHFQRLLERAVRVTTGETFDGKIKVGVLGYGGAFNMGRRHANEMEALPGFEVTTVCDLSPERTAQAKAELGDRITTFNDMDQFFGQGDFDMAVEILPHNLHAKACIQASEAGKHVVSEKPFCLTLDEADAMIAAADKAGKMVSCFHNRRWDGEFWRMLELVRSGAIGDVFRIDAASAGYGEPGAWWRTNKAISGGAMYDWGAHFTDWILNIANKPIKSISGDFQNRKWHHVSNEDYTWALIRFEDDTTATLEQGSMAAIGRQRWRILGTHGGLTDGPDVTKTVDMTQWDGEKLVKTNVPAANKSWGAYYANVGNHLLMGEELVVKANQARRVIGVIHLAEESAKQGGKPLAMPGEDSYTPDYMMPW